MAYGRDFTGRNYVPGMDVKEIAKRVRADIREAKNTGRLHKDLKTRVRIDRFAGGCSLDIRIESIPFQKFSQEFFDRCLEAGGPERFVMPYADTLSQEMRDTFNVLQDILSSYKRDDSDIQSDYFDVNFYGSVELDPMNTPSAEEAYAQYLETHGGKSEALMQMAEDRGYEVVTLDTQEKLNINPFDGEVEADGSYTWYASGC